MTDIPNEVTIPTGVTSDIPEAVAVMPQEVEAPEATPYSISFVNYNERMCEISLLNSNKARRAVEILKAVGMKVRSSADFQRNSIGRIPVRREGEYKKLFNGLPNEVELKEIKLQQDARMFYYDIEPERTFYVVAITQNHLETEQVRR